MHDFEKVDRYIHLCNFILSLINCKINKIKRQWADNTY